ncbi:MAG: potassium/proton antiporter [Neisseria sp.]|nr:potassium/proton antiporter [Neisseria sp.]
MLGINLLFMLAALLLFVSILASTLSARLGFPLLLLFLTVGMLAGEDGIGGIKFNDFFIAGMLGQAALGVILLDGGLRTRFDSFRVALKPSAVLATWGVIATVALLGGFILLLLDLDWRYAFLLAAIVGSTDAAAVFSLLGNSGVRLNRRVRSTLEVESGANDPMAILLVTLFISLLLNEQEASAKSIITMLVMQLGLGVLFGYFGGQILAWLMSRLKLTDGLYPLLILSGGMLVFTITNIIGGSGFLAVYVCGILVGNCHSRMTESVLKVMDGMAWLAQAAMFVVLGLLVTPTTMLKYGPLALAVALFLTLVARPLAVISSIWPFGFQKREVAFISWVGLRGAVPITLAMMPAMMGVEHADLFFNAAFAVVLLSLLVQGATIPFMARLLKVTVPDRYEPVDTHEVWLSSRESLPLFAYRVVENSAAENILIGDLPQLSECEDISVLAVMDGETRTIFDEQTRLQKDQVVWLGAPEEYAEKIAHLFTDSGKEMSLRGHFFGEFTLDVNVPMSTLAEAYGLPIPENEQTLSIADWLRSRLGDLLVSGDRVEVGGFNIVVQSADSQGKVLEAGIKMPETTE